RADWEQQFDFLAELVGLDHAELWIEHDLSDNDIDWVRQRLAALKIDVIMHAPFVGISLASHDKKLRQASIDRVLHMAHIGEKIGGRVMTCHSGPVGMWVNKTTALQTLADSFAQIVAGTSVTVTLGNMPDRRGGTYEPVTTATDIAAVIAQCPGLKT